MSHHRPPPPPWTFFGSFYPKNVTFAGLLAAVFLYLTDFVVFGMVAKDFFTLPGMHDMPLMGCNVIGYLLGGLILSTVYAIYAWPNKIIDSVQEDGPGHRPKTMRGMVFGLFMALVIFLPTAFIFHSLFIGWSLKVALVEVLYRIIQFAIAGIIVANMLPDSDSVEGTNRKPIEFK